MKINIFKNYLIPFFVKNGGYIFYTVMQPPSFGKFVLSRIFKGTTSSVTDVGDMYFTS